MVVLVVVVVVVVVVTLRLIKMTGAQSACTRCVYSVYSARCGAAERSRDTRRAGNRACARPRVTCQMTSQYGATSGGRRTRSKETPDERSKQSLAESAPSGWRSRVASRRLAYRRVPLHSEVSCRCGLTGSLCAHLRCFCCCYRCRPIPLPLPIVESSAAAHIGDNATCTITDTSSRARHRAPANELNYFRAAAIHRTRLRGTRTLDRSISRDK